MFPVIVVLAVFYTALAMNFPVVVLIVTASFIAFGIVYNWILNNF